jgi:hypothetical protein
MTIKELFWRLQKHLEKAARVHGLAEDTVHVSARALSPEEAIGNPEHDDYPLIIGRERMMEAEVAGACGQAFTDMYGCWEGCVRDVCRMEWSNDFRRAILVATLNAVMRFTGEVRDTVHCKDDGPVQCATCLRSFVADQRLRPPFLLIGYQPRLAETLASLGELQVVDRDVRNIGQIRAGAVIRDPAGTEEALRAAGCVFVTGSTVVNGTIVNFLNRTLPTVFYGVTISAAAVVLGLSRYCPRALEAH